MGGLGANCNKRARLKGLLPLGPPMGILPLPPSRVYIIEYIIFTMALQSLIRWVLRVH